MKNYQNNQCDRLLDLLGFRVRENAIKERLCYAEEVMIAHNTAKALGVDISNHVFQLVLWNDDINEMDDVVIALREVCKLNPTKSVSIMKEAHQNGKSIIKSGTFETMMSMRYLLERRNLKATLIIEQM